MNSIYLVCNDCITASYDTYSAHATKIPIRAFTVKKDAENFVKKFSNPRQEYIGFFTGRLIVEELKCNDFSSPKSQIEDYHNEWSCELSLDDVHNYY